MKWAGLLQAAIRTMVSDFFYQCTQGNVEGKGILKHQGDQSRQETGQLKWTGTNAQPAKSVLMRGSVYLVSTGTKAARVSGYRIIIKGGHEYGLGWETGDRSAMIRLETKLGEHKTKGTKVPLQQGNAVLT